MKTLLLDTVVWDLVLDANGNIAVAQEPYQLAQDVASAIRLFAGELWYDISKGVPYFATILGQAPPVQLFKQYMIDAALSVPGVVSADCVISSFQGRTVTGAVTFTDSSGNTQTVPIT
jgi:hypothetical protein